LARDATTPTGTGFTLGYDKFNWDEHPHFITEDISEPARVDFGEGSKAVYALEGAQVLVQRNREVQLATNTYGRGRAVYIGGLPYSPENARILYRALLWSTGKESLLRRWFSTNPNVDVHACPGSGRYAVCNNALEPQDTTVFTGDGTGFSLTLKAGALCWFEM